MAGINGGPTVVEEWNVPPEFSPFQAEPGLCLWADQNKERVAAMRGKWPMSAVTDGGLNRKGNNNIKLLLFVG